MGIREDFKNDLYKVYRNHCRGIKRDFLKIIIAVGGNALAVYAKPSIVWWNDLFDLFTQE